MPPACIPLSNAAKSSVRRPPSTAGDYRQYTIKQRRFDSITCFRADVSPAWVEWTIWASPKAATAKATCSRKQNGKRIFWRNAGRTTVVFLFWFILATANTNPTCPATVATARWSGRRRPPPPPRPWPRSRSAQVRHNFKSNFRQPPNSTSEKPKGLDLPRTRALQVRKGWRVSTNHSYGDEFMHDDELAWAACELFLATGDQAFQRNCWNGSIRPIPARANGVGGGCMTRTGCAIRSYAFAAKAGKINPTNSTWASSQMRSRDHRRGRGPASSRQ